MPANERKTRKPQVLLVDDDKDFRELVRQILELAGYAVLEAEDGQTARSLLALSRFDAVVSDMRMPRQDGLDLLQFVKQQHDMPVILMSGFADFNEMKEASPLKADCYIAKPFKKPELLAAIQNCIACREAIHPVNAAASARSPLKVLLDSLIQRRAQIVLAGLSLSAVFCTLSMARVPEFRAQATVTAAEDGQELMAQWTSLPVPVGLLEEVLKEGKSHLLVDDGKWNSKFLSALSGWFPQKKSIVFENQMTLWKKIKSHITLAMPSPSELAVTVHAPDGELAAVLANKVAHGLIAQGQMNAADKRMARHGYIDGKLKESEKRLTLLTRQLAQLHGGRNPASETSQRFTSLARELEVENDLYNQWVKYAWEAGPQGILNEQPWRIQGAAVAPTAAENGLDYKNILTVLFLSLFIAALAAALFQGLSPRIFSAQDMEDLGIPFLGEMTNRQSVQWSHLLNPERQTGMVLAVTSSSPDKGLRTCVQDLAQHLSQEGGKTLIVDLASQFQVPATSNTTIKTVVIADKLHLVQTPVAGSDLIVQSNFLSDFVAQSKMDYRNVLLCCPPMLSSRLSLMAAGLADEVIFISRRRGRKADLARSLKCLQQTCNRPVWGLLNNRGAS